MLFRAVIVMLIPLWFSATVFSQEPVVREQTAGNVISYEHFTILDDTSYRVIVPFRIRYDFFVFIKSNNTANASPFTAGGEISSELIDSTGTSVARKIDRINLSILDNTPSAVRMQYLQDFIEFTVPRGRYTLVFTLEDKESKRRFNDSKKTLSVPASGSISSGLIPAVKGVKNEFTLINLGGDVHFSREYGFLFQSTKSFPSCSYSIVKIMPDADDDEVIVSNASASFSVFNKTSCSVVKSNNSVELSLHPAETVNTHFVSFDGSLLRQGRYELTMIFPDSSNVKTTFSARWMEMPASLYDLDLAVEPLQFIMTKSDYSDVRRGSRDSRIKKFEEFWKKKDSTPSTAYNEVMHEFYRRVDYAVTAFRTLKEMNGAVTDRGRIYILYGNPSSTERLLAPDGAPKEIWKYNSLNKIFTFEDPSKQGNYKLAEQE